MQQGNEWSRVRLRNLERDSTFGAVWTGLESFGSQGILFLVFLVLANFLTPSSFGLFAMATGIVFFFEILVTAGLPRAIVQRKGLEDSHLDSAFWMTLALGLLFTFLLLALAGALAGLFGEPRLKSLIAILSVRLLLIPWGIVPRGILSRDLRFRQQTNASLLGSCTGGAAAIVAAAFGAGVWSLVIQDCICSGIQSFVLWGSSGWLPRFRFSVRRSHELLAFSAPLMGLSATTFLNMRAVYLLVGYFLGPAPTGAFLFGSRSLVALNNLFNEAAGRVALPLFSKLTQGAAGVQKAFWRASRLLVVIALPAFAVITVMTPGLVEVLLGSRWEPAVAPVQLFMLVGIVRRFTALNDTVFNSVGRTGWTFKLSLLNSVANLGMVLMALPFGLSAVVGATVLRSLILAPVSWNMLQRLMPFSGNEFVENYKGPLAGSAALVSVGLFLQAVLGLTLSPILLLGTQAVVCASVFLLVLVLVQPGLLGEVLALRLHFTEPR